MLEKNPPPSTAQSTAESDKHGTPEVPTSSQEAPWSDQGTPLRLSSPGILRPDDQGSAGVSFVEKAQISRPSLASALKALCKAPSWHKVHFDELAEGSRLLRDASPKLAATQGLAGDVELSQVGRSAGWKATATTFLADGTHLTQPDASLPELNLSEISFLAWDGSRHLQDMSQPSGQTNPLETEATQERSADTQPSTGKRAQSSFQQVFSQADGRATTASVATGESVIQRAAALTCKVVDKARGSPQPISHIEALTLVAQGAPCAVTGPFFAHMLEHAEPALLEVMLRGMAVGADMRASQKAQLVKLMGSEGLTLSNEIRFQVTALKPCHLIISEGVITRLVQSRSR